MSIQHLMERLRPLVGSRGWDYCVVWKLSEDQRSIVWMDCCCGGADQYSTNGAGEEFNFPLSQVLTQCKDVMVQHTRSSACELLSQLPSSLTLDSGVYVHTLLSNQPRWLNFVSSLDSNIREETVGTKVLIPVSGGCLIELFVTKQVPEDPQTLNFVAAQCSILMEADMMSNNNMESSFDTDTLNPRSPFININDQNDSFIPQVSASADAQGSPLNLPYDIPANQIRLTSENKNAGGNSEVYPETSMMNSDNMNIEFVEPMSNAGTMQGNNNNDESKDLVERENGRSDSVSDCSDQNEDEEHSRNGKKGQSKNLVAERNRRKKLNDRLYTLRALVPRISKLDRASILADAIEFIKDLQKQAKDLQDELEEHSDVEDGRLGGSSGNNLQSHGSGINLVPITDPEKALAGCEMSRQNHHDPEHNTFDKPQQMEPQVEVAQVDGNEFFVKVFGEHRPGGFMRLMEALDALGLEVTNANVTSFRSLVSNVFTVEKKDSELVQADHVKDSLIELTRNPSAPWQGMNRAPENGTIPVDALQQLHNHHHHLYPNLLHGHQFLNPPPPSSPSF